MATFLGAGVGRGRRKREVKDINMSLETQENGQYIGIHFIFVLFYFKL